MLVVKREQVMFHEGKFLAEASTLGIPPGQEWPDWIAVIDGRNEGFLFLRGQALPKPAGHDFCGYTYRTQNTGIEMVVFND